MVITSVSDGEGAQIDSQGNRSYYHVNISTHTFFWVLQISCFDQKINNNLENFSTILKILRTKPTIPEHRIYNLCVTRRPVTPLRYRCVVWLNIIPKFCYLHRRLIIDQILRKRFFSKIAPFFRKYLSVFRWNLPGYFSVSFRFPQVTELGKSAAIYLADSFCQLYSALWSAWQEDPNDPQERCAMVRTSCARL